MTARNNEALSQFEIEVDGQLSVLTYKQRGNTLALLHTEVPVALRRRGIGGELARAALEYAREHDLRVLLYCHFVSAYVDQHPEYAALIRPRHFPDIIAS